MKEINIVDREGKLQFVQTNQDRQAYRYGMCNCSTSAIHLLGLWLKIY